MVTRGQVADRRAVPRWAGCGRTYAPKGVHDVSQYMLEPEKAYKNLDFLNSSAARHIRILCEYEEPRQRFLRYGVHNTVVFFGSARAVDGETAKERLAVATAERAANPTSEESRVALARAEAGVRLSPYYDAARELARRVAHWSGHRGPDDRRYFITSGGGPGIMEAANRGASDAGMHSVGLGISLPFEQGVNGYVTEDLAFEFHYFFTRKYWFLYPCKGLVIFPGGFGTMDELFETMTLVQTGKIKKDLPILLFGKEYWDRVLNLDAMVDFGTVSPGDLDLLHRTDDIDEAFTWLRDRLLDGEGAAEDPE